MIVYINWEEKEFYTETEFYNAIIKRFYGILNDEDRKKDEFDDFLRWVKHYDLVDVFNLTPDEKEDIWAEFLTYLRDSVEENMKKIFDKREFK